MKYFILSIFVALAGARLSAQTASADSTGLPGDNFDLYAALDLFKASSSLEDFEKRINDETNNVNNLDLDEDGDVDYIQVVDNMSGDAHAIQLQVAVSDTATQDVAVIEVEKNGNESADLQMVGDEELYGKDYIVEPTADNSSGTDVGKFGPGFKSVVVFNVWIWPCVQFIYAPNYVVWVSPWHYRAHPAYWHPWHPVVWAVYHPRVIAYHHPYYHCVHEHRVMRAHACYAAHQRHAAAVHRNIAAHQNARTYNPRQPSSGHATGRQAGGGRHAGGRHR
ncbi:MAG TPA: hypothetical protein VL651_01315 [Bacteroidia bacterium]|jgi:hypothetical protein|nr:hypothetical protein [Bacteroidia bacterium]